MTRWMQYAALMRLDKPVGIWLVFWPACWGLVLGAQGVPDWHLLGLFALGALLTRSAGCVLNDMADYKLDAQVERTKNRPLACGAVRLREAAVLAGLLLVCAGALLIFLPVICTWIALLAVPMIVAYPWMKRVTYWPQLFLGVTFNLGCLMGVVATQHALPAWAWVLYAAAVCWTVGYDSIYAFQDEVDDVQVGIKSTVIGWGTASEHVIAGWFVAMVGLLCWLGAWLQLSYIYWVMLLILTICWSVAWRGQQWRTAPDLALRAFKRQIWVGAWLTLAFFLGGL